MPVAALPDCGDGDTRTAKREAEEDAGGRCLRREPEENAGGGSRRKMPEAGGRPRRRCRGSRLSCECNSRVSCE